MALGVVTAGALLFACSKKDPPVNLAASASAVSAAAPPASAMVVTYDIDPKSKTSVDMAGLKEEIKADTDAAGGQLQIDLGNLANTRGEVKVDLTTLTMHTFADDQDKNDTQTRHARNWLEVGDIADAKTKAANQYVVFAIQSVDGLSATDLSKVPPKSESGEDIRTVTATVHGDFLLHGHKVQKDVPVEARFHYAAGSTPTSKPTKVDVRSKKPMEVTLAEHDVKPRDNIGKLTAWTTSLVAKVAKTADVTLDLHATLGHVD